MAAGFRWYVGDLRTGRIWKQLDLNGSWSNDVDGTGSVEGTFPLVRGAWPSVKSDTSPCKTFLAVSYVDPAGTETFLEGGPIWTTDFDEETKSLKLAAGGIWSYYDHRKLIPVLAANANPALASVTYTGPQLGYIAKRLIGLANTHTGGALPIVLPSDASLGGAGSTYSITYPGYQLASLGDKLRDLTEAGGEIQFVPRRKTSNPNYIEWFMRIAPESANLMLTQAGPAWVFEHNVPKSPIASISVKRDGTKMTFRSWAGGQGQAEGRPIARAEDLSLVAFYGFPLLESEISATDSEPSTSALYRYAAGDVAANNRPIETWTMKVHRDAKRLDVGKYRVGDWTETRIRDHLYLEDGRYTNRIVKVSGSAGSNIIELQMASRLGAA